MFDSRTLEISHEIRTLLLLMAATILIPVIVASGLALGKIREDERQTALHG